MIGEHRANRFFDYEGNEIEVGDYFKIINRWGVHIYLAEEVSFSGNLKSREIVGKWGDYYHIDSQSIYR